MENFDELLKKYADFIVRVGVNPQPGQTLIINCPLEGAPLARLCVRSAYEAGARDVQVNWSDDAVARARMELGSEERTATRTNWCCVTSQWSDKLLIFNFFVFPSLSPFASCEGRDGD